VTEQLLFTAER